MDVERREVTTASQEARGIGVDLAGLAGYAQALLYMTGGLALWLILSVVGLRLLEAVESRCRRRSERRRQRT